MNRLRYMAAGVLVLVAVLVVDVMIGSFAPDPCPVRGTMDAEEFPEMNPASKMGRVDALPIFARKYNMTCSGCHSAFPYLNSMGRAFKKNGYRLPGVDNLIVQQQKDISKTLYTDKILPIAFSGDQKLLTKATDEDLQTLPLSTLNLHSAGPVFKNGAAYVKLSAEAGGAFSVGASGRVGATISDYFNVMGGVGGLFDTDPYNTLQGHSLTASHGHGGSRFVNMWGWAGPLFYQAGVSAGADGNLDENRFGMARLAYDFTPDIMVGTFGVVGQQPGGNATAQHALYRTVEQKAAGHDDDTGGTDTGGTTGDPQDAADPAGTTEDDVELEDIVRVGGDFNVSAGDFYMLGLLEVNSRQFDDETETNLSGFAEFFYTWTLDDRPILVPLVRAEYNQMNFAEDEEVRVVGNLSSYLVANARMGVEYQQQLVVPDDQENGYRLTWFTNWAW